MSQSKIRAVRLFRKHHIENEVAILVIDQERNKGATREKLQDLREREVHVLREGGALLRGIGIGGGLTDDECEKIKKNAKSAITRAFNKAQKK